MIPVSIVMMIGGGGLLFLLLAALILFIFRGCGACEDDGQTVLPDVLYLLNFVPCQFTFVIKTLSCQFTYLNTILCKVLNEI